MFWDVLQQVMESEVDAKLGYEKSQRISNFAVENKRWNYRNGHSKKTVKTQIEAVEVKVPRDRNGTYESQIISKYSRNLDVYLCCVDGLKDFVEAIAAVYPQSQVQRGIIRSSTRFVSYKHINPLMADLKKVYTSVTEDEALEHLVEFRETWSKQYPSCVKSWEENWEILSTFFAYPRAIRKIIYTTNIIEGLNRQFRRITKNKPSFTNDDFLRKMFYLASRKIVERWMAGCRNWDIVLAQLQLMFRDRKSV